MSGVMFISRERGASIRHVRQDKSADTSLCGVRPKPINPDMTAKDCWLTIMATDNPKEHANCDRCVAALTKKGPRK